jgi:hypothetical protein
MALRRALLRVPVGRVPVRTFASGSGQPAGVLDRLADRLNQAIEEVPRAYLASFVATDIGMVMGMYGAIGLLGINPSAEMALAFAITRPLKRIRLPLELLAAKPLAILVPQLAKVQVVRVLMPSYVRPLVPPSVVTDQGAKALFKSLAAVGIAAIDKYGLAYAIAARLVGALLVFGAYGVIRSGVDVQGWMDAHGFGDLGSTAGQWGLAVVSASALYPLSIVGVAFAAHPLARAVPFLRGPLAP